MSVNLQCSLIKFERKANTVIKVLITDLRCYKINNPKSLRIKKQSDI